MAGRSVFGFRLVLLLAVTAIGLSACGDKEAAQRKAFIEFLQTRIVGKPGIHVPKLTTEEADAFGDYAKQYAIIADFNGRLDQAVSKPLQHALEAGAPRSLGEVVARRPDIVGVEAGLVQIRAALDRELAAANAARDALKQPDDLKPVYAAAYDRDVTQPAKTFVEIFPDIDAALKSIVALADYLGQHQDAISIGGMMIRTSDPSLQEPLQALLDGVREKNEGIVKAKQKLRALVSGS
jgi:hypothetical protein